MKTLITMHFSQPVDSIELYDSLGDLNCRLTAGPAGAELMIEVIGEDWKEDLLRHLAALPDTTRWPAAISERLVRGQYEEKDNTPDFEWITLPLIWQAAETADLNEAISLLTDKSGIEDWSWFEPETYDDWADMGVQECISILMDWLLAVREHREVCS